MDDDSISLRPIVLKPGGAGAWCWGAPSHTAKRELLACFAIVYLGHSLVMN